MKPKSKNSRGFALIATILLMVLLAILTVGTLSLSVVTLRTGTQDSAQAQARANARLALMIAIGELQKQVGPDQRITANGAILSENAVRNPHWMGVWDSWIAGNPTDAPVKSNYPSTASHHQTIGNQPNASMHPDYSNKNRHFRQWLLSLNETESTDMQAALNLTLHATPMPDLDSQAVLLVGSGSLGESADTNQFIGARLMDVNLSTSSNNGKGRYAWWVGDQHQKGLIVEDSYETHGRALTNAEKIFRAQSPASMGTRTIEELASLNDESKLAALPTLKTLDLVVGNTDQNPSLPSRHFHDLTTSSFGVLADVREGGLKRDLSAILERPINPEEVYTLQSVTGTEAQFRRASGMIPASSTSPGGDDFMLYRFDNMVNSLVGSPTGEAAVPIQDLAAYYQTYDHYRPESKGGIQFSSQHSSPSNGQLNSGIMASNPDYGQTTGDYIKYLRQHSALYRSVYPVKIEFLLSYLTEQRTQAELNADIALGITDPDPYKLRIGYTPSMTFWNPNNVPVVMNLGNPNLASIMIRETPVPLAIDFRKHDSFGGPATQTVAVDLNKVTNTQQGELYTLFISGRAPLVFQPGESKVLALQVSSHTNPAAGLEEIDFQNRGQNINEDFFPEHELVPGWNPERFVRPAKYRFLNRKAGTGEINILTFKPTDYISSAIRIGARREFNVDYTQKSRHGRNAPGVMWHYRTYGIRSRLFPGGNPNWTVFTPYRTAFLSAGLPPSGGNIAENSFTNIVNPPRSGQILVNAMQDPANLRDDLPQAFFYYGMKAATETHESNHSFPSSGSGSGRRFPSRPFLHSTVMIPQFIDTIAGSSLYNYGWNWFFSPLNNILDAPISISQNNHGYYGGGYTAENGTTHVVQQFLPITPPISIASLSNAHLSGYSLSSEAAAAGYNGLQNLNGSEAFRRTTALGFGGLEPRTLQAIGNSYAHPNIPRDRAITTWRRVYFQNNANENNTAITEPFADHSYLANKALWDDFFFSSITPVPANNPMFGTSAKTVEQVAKDFFFENAHLPNRRMVPYTTQLDEYKLGNLLDEYAQFKGGFADKIASHMMVEGPFNINSTSVRAWKMLFSSLKGKPVCFLNPEKSVSNQSEKMDEHRPAGVPVGGGSVVNAQSYTGSSSDPSDPEQWLGWRELSDAEIDELAVAMVKQVKKRGPFLSLSEFINRRLSTQTEFALRGALQAAIDDPDCSINSGFRNSSRTFSNRERNFVNAVFPEAMEGPIAYGSAAYIDQADVLRNIGTQLTARGDTFVIRTYGDALDQNGKVTARAWCEAVVQRLPDYLDETDSPEIKQADLTSDTNKTFGRKLQVIGFRWLNASEI